MKELGNYKNGNYTVTIYDDGTKVRETNDDKFIPNFAECIDVNLSYKCNVGCKFCYLNCNPRGREADLKSENTLKFLDSLKPYTEIALNLNNYEMKGLKYFLTEAKKRNIIANVTVNIKIIDLDYLLDLKKDNLIHGIGVSISDFNNLDKELILRLSKIDDIVFHLVAGIVTANDMLKLSEIADLKVLILGYKNIGKGETLLKNNFNIINNINLIKNNINGLKNFFKVMSFDNLAVKQLNLKERFKDIFDDYYMGDDGQFTYYVDLVYNTFSKSSLDKNTIFKMQDFDYDSTKMFQFIRERYESNKKISI